MANLSKKVRVTVTEDDILKAECRNPNKCMIKVAVARALDVPHGYIHVDASGIAVTRRKDFREKAFLPTNVKDKMILFDNEALPVKAYSFSIVFHKTSRVYALTPKRKEQINKARRGKHRRKYSLRERVIGLAVSPDVAKAIKKSKD